MNETKLEALRECEEYLEARADADHNGERYVGNAEMNLLTTVRNALASPDDPRIAAAEKMANALERFNQYYESDFIRVSANDGRTLADQMHLMAAALAAWNALK